MEGITEAVNNLNISDSSASTKKNRIQVSNTKKPLFFYVNLAKVLSFYISLVLIFTFFVFRWSVWLIRKSPKGKFEQHDVGFSK